MQKTALSNQPRLLLRPGIPLDPIHTSVRKSHRAMRNKNLTNRRRRTNSHQNLTNQKCGAIKKTLPAYNLISTMSNVSIHSLKNQIRRTTINIINNCRIQKIRNLTLTNQLRIKPKNLRRNPTVTKQTEHKTLQKNQINLSNNSSAIIIMPEPHHQHHKKEHHKKPVQINLSEIGQSEKSPRSPPHTRAVH